MRHTLVAVPLLLVVARVAPLAAQGGASTSPGAAAAAPAVIPPRDQQIAAAVLPLAESQRGGARVWGYGPDGVLVELRSGTGNMTCIADDPKDNRFHVACYHNSMEPFMARGRELRAQGARQQAVDSVRRAEVASGRIRMPAAASLFSLTGPAGSYDAATNTTRGANRLFVIYVPNATAESVGVSATPARGTPWIMHPGTPNAHIMFVPDM